MRIWISRSRLQVVVGQFADSACWVPLETLDSLCWFRLETIADELIIPGSKATYLPDEQPYKYQLVHDMIRHFFRRNVVVSIPYWILCRT